MPLKSSITDRQMAFLLFVTLVSYSRISITKTLVQSAGTGGWFPLMVTALFFAAFVWVIVRLNSAFPGMTLFDYGQRITGKVLGYAFAAYFMVYFLLTLGFLSMKLTEVLKAEFYPKTPEWATLISSIFVCGFVAYRGVTGVARFFEVTGTVFLIFAAITYSAMLYQGNLQEIRPFFRASKLPDYLLAIKDTVTPFLGIEVLTVFPLSGKAVKRTTATASLTVLFVGFVYVVVVEGCIMMLGMRSTLNYNYALIEAIKQLDIPVIERFDIIHLTAGFAALVAGICALYLALVEYAVRLFNKINRLVVVAGVGVLVTCFSLAAQAMKPVQKIIEGALPFAGLVAAFFIPATLLLTAKVRGLVQKPE
jgi:spore germination protein (amino acid permease)